MLVGPVREGVVWNARNDQEAQFLETSQSAARYHRRSQITTASTLNPTLACLVVLSALARRLEALVR